MVTKRPSSMVTKRPSSPLEWNEVRSDEGAVIGRYAARDGMITVQYATGGEKTTQASAVGGNEGLARIMLSELSR